MTRSIAPIRMDEVEGRARLDAAYLACLEPLLRRLDWRGGPRQIAEATGMRAEADLMDFRNTMANLDFNSTERRGKLSDIDVRLLPCLFVTRDHVRVILSVGETDETLTCFDGGTRQVVEIDDIGQQGRICTFQRIASETPAQVPRSWIAGLLHRFERRLLGLLALTLVLNVLALSPAFFVQAVYDRILPARNLETLGLIGVGIALALTCDVLLRLIRGAVISHLGARLDFLIGTSVVGKIMSMPLARLEKVAVGARIGQLREFETLRNAFAGPLVLSLLEIPFILIFVAAIAFIGGWLALVPVAFALAMVAFGLMIIRYLRESLKFAEQSSSDYQSLMIEILSNMGSIKASGTESLWMQRFRDRSSRYAMSNLQQSRIAGLTDSIAYGINLFAGASTLTIGAILAMNGSLSVGALIASMTLVWRMLAPIQMVFVTLSRVDQISRASRRVDAMMATPSETGLEAGHGSSRGSRRFAGRITFDRVFLRYDAHHEPALAGVSFDVRPGEIVALTGGNGSGKSTVLKMIASLYHAQAGSVLIDGVDTRQLGPLELRQWVTFLPQQSDIFPGSLRENLLLGNPVAAEHELWDALSKVGLIDEVEALPEKLDTQIGDFASANFTRKLVLARTLLIDASIVLLDEPGSITDANGEDLLLEQFDVLRGRVTVLIATHNPEHVRISDRTFVLRNGTIVHDGTPQELMDRLRGGAR